LIYIRRNFEQCHNSQGAERESSERKSKNSKTVHTLLFYAGQLDVIYKRRKRNSD